MSTRLYLECRSHDPLITDDAEVGHNLTDLPDVQRWLAGRDRILEALKILEDFDIDHFDIDTTNRQWLNAVRFMKQHPTCVIGIRDEYGRGQRVEEGDLAEAPEEVAPAR